MGSPKSPMGEFGIRRVVYSKKRQRAFYRQEVELDVVRDSRWHIYRSNGEVVEIVGSKLDVFSALKDEGSWIKLVNIVNGINRWTEINYGAEKFL